MSVTLGTLNVTISASTRPQLSTWQAHALGPQLHIGRKPTVEQWVPATTIHPERGGYACYGFKPYGGFWTSTYLGPDKGSDWVRWCRGEDFGSVDSSEWWLLTPASDSPVIIIDGWRDFDAILDRYGIPLYPDSPPLRNQKAWDFSRMVEDGYAGLHLSEDAAMELHWYRREYDFSLSLNSWDCESTVWFAWSFDEPVKVEPVRGEDAA